MGNLIANNKGILFDSMITQSTCVRQFQTEDFITLFGFVYPIIGDWSVFRIINSSKSNDDFYDKEFCKRFIGINTSIFALLDWDSNVFEISVLSPTTCTNIINIDCIIDKLPLSDRPVICTNIDPAVASGISLLMKPKMPLLAAAKVFDSISSERIKVPMFLSYEEFLKKKPSNPRFLPNLRLSNLTNVPVEMV